MPVMGPVSMVDTLSTMPILLTFKDFLTAPRQGELLDALRKLPKRERSLEEVTLDSANDSAMEALSAAQLLWLIDRPSDAGSLPKGKQRLWRSYQDSSQALAAWRNAHRMEIQRWLYDSAVTAGLIQAPTSVATPSE